MPHWLAVTLAAAGALASWRWVIRPVRRGWGLAVGFLEQIRDSAGGIQSLAHEVHVLAGAMTRYVISNQQRLGEHDQQLADLSDRLANLSDLLLDMAADVARQQRADRTDGDDPD